MDVRPISNGAARDLREAAPSRNRRAGGDFSRALAAARETDSQPSHTVQRGESIWRICAAHLGDGRGKFSRQDIQDAVTRVSKANGLANPDAIHPGQILNLASLEAPGNVTSGGQTRMRTPRVPPAAEALLPRLAPANATSFRDARAVIRAAAYGEPHDTRPAVRASRPSATAGTSGDLVERIRAILARRHDPRAGDDSIGALGKVLAGPAEVSSRFGFRKDPFTGRREHHDGVDLAVPKGTHIHPVQSGRVAFSGWQGGYGNVVIVRHADGTETVYGHNKENLVHAGQRVTADTTLALSGSSGRSTGPHLHFEVRKNGQATDPTQYIAQQPFQVAKAL